MAPSTIRKAIGAVKDQTSISIAKVAGNIAPDLEVLVVKATSHDDEPADGKYINDIITLTSRSRGYVTACVAAVSKRLSKTHDWIVAIKGLMLVHRLLVDGHPSFQEEIVVSTRRGMRVLNFSEFRDETNLHSWDHVAFVRFYALFLDEKIDVEVAVRKWRGGDGEDRRLGFDESNDGFRARDDSFDYAMSRRSRSYGDMNDGGDDSVGRDKWKEGGSTSTLIRQMKPEMVLRKLCLLLRMLDRVFACRPTGMAKNSRLVLVSLYALVKESFVLYADICDALGVVLDRFTEMEYEDCVEGFDMYVSAAKMIDELVGFYGWCKDVGVARSSEFPAVKRITDQLLGTLQGFLKEMRNRSSSKSPERNKEEKIPIKPEAEAESNMTEIKALPPPENYYPPTPPVPQPKPQPRQVSTEDLVNLRDGVSADEQGNKLALALFSEPPTSDTNGAWESFPTNGEAEVISAWQTPAAESGKANWELALVETASNLSKQKADLGGGMDPLLLNGMYDQGVVRQHVNATQFSCGSASSVALALSGKSTTPVLALPSADGTFQPVGNQDPFAASLAIPPPSYVQMADMERKQHLVVQEEQLWQQYGKDGMHGQVGLTQINRSGYYGLITQPQPGGYYYTHQ
ncbi:putative clathrin assembly protein At2g25430 [Mercurialis annua]|uniref:putative clathrin assembly protein At2g25430 n=1 Tax=Mercurialis annua TaxID=3986 RepID=UPI002160BA66|nr:putative clathrin assembly protein At2g25430 [Mercurialis annua]